MKKFLFILTIMLSSHLYGICQSSSVIALELRPIITVDVKDTTIVIRAPFMDKKAIKESLYVTRKMYEVRGESPKAVDNKKRKEVVYTIVHLL